MILAPLRGVTIRAFRRVFAEAIVNAGFIEAFTPFISAMAGVNPLKDRELAGGNEEVPFKVTPQFIGKDPLALRAALRQIKSAGYDTADLNCGCPFPMVRNKGRGAGILKTPEVLRAMLAVGCEEMGPGKFSIKTRLGVDRADELKKLMPIINEYPLRFLTVHGRIARQMYSGEVNVAAIDEIMRLSKVPIVRNGDLTITHDGINETMVGRSFIRDLGERDDIGEYLLRYIEISRAELCGEKPVLGRIKELASYWKDSSTWNRRWQVLKICRSIDEFIGCIK